MLSKNSEIGAKRSGAKSPKGKKNVLATQTRGAENEDDRHQMIATAAYYRAEQRSFQGSSADAMQDWLEAEEEVEAVDARPIDDIN